MVKVKTTSGWKTVSPGTDVSGYGRGKKRDSSGGESSGRMTPAQKKATDAFKKKLEKNLADKAAADISKAKQDIQERGGTSSTRIAGAGKLKITETKSKEGKRIREVTDLRTGVTTKTMYGIEGGGGSPTRTAGIILTPSSYTPPRPGTIREPTQLQKYRLTAKEISGEGVQTKAIDVGGGMMQDYVITYSGGEIISTVPTGPKFPQTQKFINVITGESTFEPTGSIESTKKSWWEKLVSGYQATEKKASEKLYDITGFSEEQHAKQRQRVLASGEFIQTKAEKVKSYFDTEGRPFLGTVAGGALSFFGTTGTLIAGGTGTIAKKLWINQLQLHQNM